MVWVLGVSRVLSLANTEQKQPWGRPGQQLQEGKRSQTRMDRPGTCSQARDAEATPLAKRVLVVAAGQRAWWPRKWVLGPDSSPLTPGPGDSTGTPRGASGTSRGRGHTNRKDVQLREMHLEL